MCFLFQKIPCPCTLPRNKLRNTSISRITRTSNTLPPLVAPCHFVCSQSGRAWVLGAYMWRSNALRLRSCSSTAIASHGIKTFRRYSSVKSLPVTNDEFKQSLAWGLLPDVSNASISTQLLGRSCGKQPKVWPTDHYTQALQSAVASIQWRWLRCTMTAGSKIRPCPRPMASLWTIECVPKVQKKRSG